MRKSAARMQAELQAPDGRLLGPGEDISRIANTRHPLNMAGHMHSARVTITDQLQPAFDVRDQLIDYTTQLKLQDNIYLYDDYRAHAYRMGGHDAVRQAQLGYDPRFVPDYIRAEVATEVDMVLMLPFEAGAVVAKPFVSGAGRLGGQLLESGRLNPLNYRISPHGVYGGAPVPQVRFTGTGAFGRTPLPSSTPSPSGFAPHGFNPPPGTRQIPEGIPDTWRIRPTQGEGGVWYYDPMNKGNAVRVMPGDPNSPFPNSQSPYVRWQRNGQPLNIDGTVLPTKKSPDAHIPLMDFHFNPEVFK